MKRLPAGKYRINQYTVEILSNKDVLISEKRIRIVTVLAYWAFTVAMVWIAIINNSDLQYVCAFLAFIGLFASLVSTWQWISPERMLVSHEKNEIEVRKRKLSRIIGAGEIRQFRFWHQAVARTTTGVGPKAHLQWLVVDLKDGSDILLFELKAAYDGLSHTGREKDDADQLIGIVQDSLKTYIPYSHN